MYDYSKIDKKVKDITKKVSLYMDYKTNEEISEAIYKAYSFALNAHEGQLRLSGEPYINHPVEATLILLELKPDLQVIQACLLHDVIEDTEKTIDDIKENFGDEVAFLCEGMVKLSKVRYEGEERNIGSLRKMFIAMSEDLRVIFIKLSDRLHNMRTLKYHPKPEKRERIALETLNIYAPIADRLGLFKFKNNLEEECFKILEPIEYRRIKQELELLKSNITEFSKVAKSEIDEILNGEVDNYEVSFRVKSIYSIYKKIKLKGYENVESMYDLLGVKILVDDIATCYRVLGIIHGKWSPIPNRFKDYIALPKPNGYRSLHTTIIGFIKSFRQQPTEIQIKTFEMNEYADIGVAAHFEYKEKGSRIANDIDWVKDLKNITESLGNSDFMATLRIDVFKDRIFVFTPKGRSINLPAGSTPIDFAYAIHSDIGNHTSLAKVDGRVYPLDKELKNGDVIEIITDNSKKPNPFRLSFVKTTHAKDRIRAFLKRENKDFHIENGKEILNKYFEKTNLPLLDKELSILKVIDGREYSLDERYSLLEQIGNFSLNPSSVIRKIVRDKTPLPKNQDSKQKTEDKAEKSAKLQKENLIIGGETGIDYKLCKKCISAHIPNKIVGHINSKGVVTIHNRKCPILNNVNKERLLPAYRAGEEDNYIIVTVKFLFVYKIGTLNDLTDILYSMSIRINSMSSKRIGENKYEIILSMEIQDYDYLLIDRFVDRVKVVFGENLVETAIENIKM